MKDVRSIGLAKRNGIAESAAKKISAALSVTSTLSAILKSLQKK